MNNLSLPGHSLVIVVGILFLGVAFYLHKGGYFARWQFAIGAQLRALLARVRSGDETMENILDFAGYAYDASQDIFYSTLDAWQRNFGYFRLYDEAAAPLNMIIDCEPIYFDYEGKKWKIQMWKGQYALTLGAEIGVYNSTWPELNIPGVFQGTFFECAGDDDLLHMSFVLKKDGKILFRRTDKHWWLTGFILGEFAEPWELTMDVQITLKDRVMRNAFIDGLLEAGYANEEIRRSGNTVSLVFADTKTPQPYTRTPATDWIIQRKNEFLCQQLRELTSAYENTPAKLKALKQQAPELYGQTINIGKHKQLYQAYESIQEYLK